MPLGPGAPRLISRNVFFVGPVVCLLTSWRTETGLQTAFLTLIVLSAPMANNRVIIPPFTHSVTLFSALTLFFCEAPELE